MGYVNGAGVARTEQRARNSEIYERALLGETHSSLAREFGLHHSRIYAIASREEHCRRIAGRPWGQRLLVAWARAAYIEDLEPME